MKRKKLITVLLGTALLSSFGVLVYLKRQEILLCKKKSLIPSAINNNKTVVINSTKSVKENSNTHFQERSSKETQIQKEFDFNKFKDVKKFFDSQENRAWLLGQIPVEQRTIKVCKYAMSKNASSFKYVPIEIITPNMCFQYIESEHDLEYIPAPLLTFEMCLCAINKIKIDCYNDVFSRYHNPFDTIFKCIPKSLWNKELCIEVLKCGGYNTFKNIPEQLWTDEICKIAIKNGVSEGFKRISKKYITKELCIEGISKCPYIIFDIPQECLTEDLWLIYAKSVYVDGTYFKQIPNEFLTPIVLKELIYSNPNLLRSFPKEVRTSEVCTIAIEKNGTLLRSIPIPLRTEDICLKAVKNCHDSKSVFPAIPKKVLTSQIYLFALINNNCKVSDIPEAVLTEEFVYDYLSCCENVKYFLNFPKNIISKRICELAYKKGIKDLKVFPDEYITKEMCDYIIHLPNRWHTLDNLPIKKRTADICLEAVKYCAANIQYVPVNLITKEICDIALSYNDDYLKYVPDKFKTVEICRKLLANNKSLLRYIPKNIQDEIFSRR